MPMEGNQTLRISSPRFDEEWTVLTARRVVPFAELKSNSTRRKALKLVGAFAVAIVMGAVVALFETVIRERDSDVVQVGYEIPERSIVDDVESSPGESDAVLEDPDAEPALVKAPRRPVTLTAKTEASPSRTGTSTLTEPHETLALATMSEAESEPDQPVVNRFEERRLRRAIRRQHRERAVDGTRSLLRIDEIFEGVRPRK